MRHDLSRLKPHSRNGRIDWLQCSKPSAAMTTMTLKLTNESKSLLRAWLTDKHEGRANSSTPLSQKLFFPGAKVAALGPTWRLTLNATERDLGSSESRVQEISHHIQVNPTWKTSTIVNYWEYLLKRQHKQAKYCIPQGYFYSSWKSRNIHQKSSKAVPARHFCTLELQATIDAKVKFVKLGELIRSLHTR